MWLKFWANSTEVPETTNNRDNNNFFITRETTVLNNENAELQNKLDSLKSFDNVDKTLQENNMLQKAGQVIETDAVEIGSNDNSVKSKKKKIFSYAIGF